LAVLIGGAASAQEGKGWLGADVLDVTKAEADKLGWDLPRGAKVGVVASGSPAEKAGLKTDDIIPSIDRMMIESGSDAIDLKGCARRCCFNMLGFASRFHHPSRLFCGREYRHACSHASRPASPSSREPNRASYR
jgi:hypothetical protein